MNAERARREEEKRARLAATTITARVGTQTHAVQLERRREEQRRRHALDDSFDDIFQDTTTVNATLGDTLVRH